MWNLFKEVWRSLFKNKVVLAGLTLLVFITSGVFTVLHDTAKSMSKQRDDYKKLSKSHNLTVDYNLPIQGDTYNNGYFINGLSREQGISTYNKPIKYETNELIKKKNKILTDNIKDKYVPINTFLNSKNEYANKYIKISDFINLYNTYDPESPENSFLSLDFSQQKKYFKLKNNKKFTLYTKNNNNQYEESHIEVKVNKNKVFTLDKEYLLRDIVYITNDEEKDVFFSRVSALFVNVETNELTFDVLKGHNWEKDGIGYKLDSLKIVNLLGFNTLNDRDLVYKRDNTINPILINIEETDKINDFLQKSLNNTLNYSDIFKEEATFNKKEVFNFEKEINYTIPSEWAIISYDKTYYERLHYESTFINDFKEKWSGSYKTFMENLISENNGVLPKEYQDFSYWNKEIVNFSIPFVSNENSEIVEGQPEILNKTNLVLQQDEISKVKLIFSPENKIEQPDVNFEKYNYQDTKTIQEIENLKKITTSQYNQIVDKDWVQKVFNKIKAGALSVIKKEIYQNIEEKVGQENIGIRQSITIDSFSDEKEKKVYHFVNVGDDQNSIQGIKNNLNLLINRDIKSSLNDKEINLSKFFLSHQISPFISNIIIQNVLFNVFPDPKYIKLDFEFNKVSIIDEVTKETDFYQNGKVIKLAHYLPKENLSKEEYNKFAEIGLFIKNTDEIIVVKPEYDNNSQIQGWKNYYIEGLKNSLFKRTDSASFETWLFKNNLTLKVEVGEEGWAEQSLTYKNLLYVPFIFRAPSNDILNQALTESNLKLALSLLEKNFFNSDLYKKGFIKQDVLISFIKAADYSIQENNFAKVFATGNFNLNILPKMIFDLIYFMTQNNNNDHFKKLIVDFLENIISLVKTKPSEEERKEYLAKNIINVFNFVEVLTRTKISTASEIKNILNASKDIVGLLEIITQFIKNVDFISFTNKVNNFFLNKYNKKEIVDGVEYQRKLSLFDIVIWLLESIDQKNLKSTLIRIIDNLDKDLLLDFNSPDNPLSFILKTIPEPLRKILVLIDAHPNSSESYSNVINGVKFLIEIFDVDVFIKELKSSLKSQTHSFTTDEKSLLTNSAQKITRHTIINSLSNTDIEFAVLKAFFNTPGSSQIIKEKIIEIFNISSLGRHIEINENEFLSVPASDENKLDFFDLLEFFSNFNVLDTTESYFDKIEQFIKKYENNDKIVFNELTRNEKDIALKFFKWTSNDIIFDPKNNETIKSWKDIVNVLKNDPNDIYKEDIKNKFGFLASEYFKFKPDQNKLNTFWNLINTLFSKLIKVDENNYDYFKSLYPILKVWFKLFSEQGVDFSSKIFFADELLKFINSEFVINEFNSFELFQPAALNIASYNKTNFGISRSLANPDKMAEYFFEYKNNQFVKKELNDFINKFENKDQIVNFILNNKFILTQNIAYIASAQKYLGFSDDDINFKNITLKYKNILSTVVNSLIELYATNANFQKYFNEINFILTNDFNSVSIERLGISDVILNPVLLRQNPQVVLWYFADTNNVGDDSITNSNIAYLIKDKIINFEDLVTNKEKGIQFINSLFTEKTFLPNVESEVNKSLAIDENVFSNLKEKVELNKEDYQFFGLDLYEVLIGILDSVTSYTVWDNVLNFNQPASYVAKVNYAFLKNNNKEIYAGAIPNNPIEVLRLIKSLPDKYLISVNESKYIIIGDDISYDYFYPVIDEANLQVNTNDQAIIYVNQNGFDRIKQAYLGTLVKEYLTVNYANKTEKELTEYKNNLNEYILQKTNDPLKLQRVYLSTELDPINPERSLRVSIVENLTNSVQKVSNVLLIILVSLVAISIIFIIKRYIAGKNKVIGILIAQGYTPLQISLSLSVFGLFTILVGGILGYTTGFLLQGVGVKILQNYWTVPVETLNFSFISFAINLLVPLAGMVVLIVAIALRALRFKSIDLMSGITEVKTNNLYFKYQKLFEKANIKTKFSSSLVFNSFWKLFSFGISVVLASVTTVFGFATFGVFQKTIDNTYKNRNFNYKFDLTSPTRQGGPINTYSLDNLIDDIYVPVGSLSEYNKYQSDYFSSGYSSAINVDGANGNPNPFNGHVITQFSVSINITSDVISIDPFSLVFNSLPDTQKARVLKTRDIVGNALMKTQKGLIFEENSNFVDLNKTYENGLRAFFQYIPDINDVKNGRFYRLEWNDEEGKYLHKIISTTEFRNEYREFLINGYKEIKNDIDAADFFVSFNTLLFEPGEDEKYTYVDSEYKNEKIRLYGYQKDSAQIKIENNGENLLEKINNQFEANNFDLNKPIPIVINKVVSDKFKLFNNSTFKLKVKNHVDRFSLNLEKELGNSSKQEDINQKINKEYEFIVVGINQTFINNEFIIPKKAADFLTGIDEIVEEKVAKFKDKLPADFDKEKYKFNGLFSQNEIPKQLINATGLYSVSGYGGSIDKFNISNTSDKDKKDFFDALFGSQETVQNLKTPGLLIRLGYSNEEVAKFLEKDYNPNKDDFRDIYNNARNVPDAYINKLADIFENQMHIPLAYTLESKSIEVGFTLSIANTVQTIVTIVTILSFLVSIIILIIISTILVNENEKNIAIWSILGYTNKEKIKMFFGIYVPFIIISLLIALPIAFGFMLLFNAFLTASASISVPLTINFVTFISTVSVVFGVFIVTTALAWFNINKIKAIDLLKGK
ncbi:ABC transporter permease [Mycoplasma leonicaptivi]|uniref:ABC transporter permease n=1 Tax=Mycoplasma leonicaptivi TaxID=36742 RepID=UPI0004897444|nr:ABC transporter permease [Mycoplasma leonicaptivi]